ncbi:MAG: hypothetical protein U0R69_00810 [Gaiellales bacterium]
MSNGIDEYLDELGRALPRSIRARILAEVEDHLRESAKTHGDGGALARFGSARELARELRTTAAASAIRRSALLLLAALVPAVLIAFPLPHGLLPPAWGTSPAGVAWPDGFAPAAQQDAIAMLLLATAALALAGVAAALARRRRLALMLVTAGIVSMSATISLAAILALGWGAAVDGEPSALWIAGYAFAGALAVAAATRSTATAAAALHDRALA